VKTEKQRREEAIESVGRIKYLRLMIDEELIYFSTHEVNEYWNTTDLLAVNVYVTERLRHRVNQIKKIRERTTKKQFVELCKI